jgi:CRISPR/Cas system-associated exonuclease Cas4 (RecB family)
MSIELLTRYGLHAKAPDGIDSSMLKDFMDCPSMFYLRHVLGLRRRFRSASEIAKFDWGTCWHGGLETFWKIFIEHESFDQAQTGAIVWIDNNFPAGIRPDTDKHKRGKERMFRIFLEYLAEFFEQDVYEFETLRTEQAFDVFDDEVDLRWLGRLDLFRRRRKNRKFVIWDYKTTSAMSDSYFDSHEHGFQLPGYVWAGQRLITDEVEEIMLDIVYTLTASHKFFRRTFRYPPQVLNEWVTNVKLILDEIHYMLENYLHEPEAWKKNKNECTRYGRCGFVDVHFTPQIGDTRLRILESDYLEERWDPLAHVEEEAA